MIDDRIQRRFQMKWSIKNRGVRNHNVPRFIDKVQNFPRQILIDGIMIWLSSLTLAFVDNNSAVIRKGECYKTNPRKQLPS